MSISHYIGYLLDKALGLAVYYCETYYIGYEGKNLREGMITENRGSWKPGSKYAVSSFWSCYLKGLAKTGLIRWCRTNKSVRKLAQP
jgi:hypothetical protein